MSKRALLGVVLGLVLACGGDKEAAPASGGGGAAPATAPASKDKGGGGGNGAAAAGYLSKLEVIRDEACACQDRGCGKLAKEKKRELRRAFKDEVGGAAPSDVMTKLMAIDKEIEACIEKSNSM